VQENPEQQEMVLVVVLAVTAEIYVI